MCEYKGQMMFVMTERQFKNNNRDCAKICNRNRWGNNWITSETGGLQCISPVLHIVQAYKHRWVLRMLSSKSVCIFVFCFRMKQ